MTTNTDAVPSDAATLINRHALAARSLERDYTLTNIERYKECSDALLVAITAAPSAHVALGDAAPAQSREPFAVYQLRMADGSWIDQAEHSYRSNVAQGHSGSLRILYAISQPAQTAQSGDTFPVRLLSESDESLAWRVDAWHQRNLNQSAVVLDDALAAAEIAMRDAFYQQLGEIWETALDAKRHIWSLAWGSARAAFPQPVAQKERALTDAEIENGWHKTFSTSNPYCPCNLKSFTKAVRWAEWALTAAQPAPGAPHD